MCPRVVDVNVNENYLSMIGITASRPLILYVEYEAPQARTYTVPYPRIGDCTLSEVDVEAFHFY